LRDGVGTASGDGVGAAPGDPPATLSGVLGRAVERGAVHLALLAGLRDHLPGEWPFLPAGPGPYPTAVPESGWPEGPDPEILSRYRSEGWTWRR
ncbi:MAG: hypothetical protein RQ751_05000, partial [Longimicrobiales bacterium]|nr:hypothetical protein [Longimicrobiales bacterium]